MVRDSTRTEAMGDERSMECTLRHTSRHVAPHKPAHCAIQAGTLCHTSWYVVPHKLVRCATQAGMLCHTSRHVDTTGVDRGSVWTKSFVNQTYDIRL